MGEYLQKKELNSIVEVIMPDFDFYSIQFNGTYEKFYKNISMEEF